VLPCLIAAAAVVVDEAAAETGPLWPVVAGCVTA